MKDVLKKQRLVRDPKNNQILLKTTPLHCQSIRHVMKPIVTVFVLSVCLSFTGVAQAQFRETLNGTNAGKIILSVNPRLLTDEVRKKIANGKFQPIADRTEEAQQAINTLIRIKGKNPVLLGEAGVGKTAVVEKISQMIVQGQIPTGKVFSQEIAQAEIIQIEASALKLLGKKPEDAALALVQNIKQLETQLNKPIILFIDEIHSVESGMWDVLKTSMDAADENGIRLIGATTEKEFQSAFGADEAMMRRFAPIGVAEFTEEKTIQIIKQSWRKIIEDRYDVVIDDEMVSKVVKHYKKVLPDISRPDGPIKTMTDLAIESHAANNRNITAADLFTFIKKRTKIPADPQNLEDINHFLNDKKSLLKGTIIGQEAMIDTTLSVYRNLLLSSGDRPEVIALMGPTGVGKTYLAENIAEALFGGKQRFFKIDGSAFADEGTSLTGLLGARPGSAGFKETMGSGTLVEWMRNPGKGRFGGVLLIDEIEKMHPERLKELAMNLFDNGEVTDGKGKKVKVPNLLIIATSNHGVNQIFPEGYAEWSDEEIKRRVLSYSQKDLKDLFTANTTADSKYKLPIEIVNRMGTYVIANPLSLDSAYEVAKLEFAKREKTFKERNGMDIHVTPEAMKYITEQSYNKEHGLRDLSRSIERFFGEITQVSTDKDLTVDIVKSGAKRNWAFSVKTPSKNLEIKDHSFKGSGEALSAEDMKDLKTLEERVNKDIYGQEELVSKSINAIRNWKVIPTGKPLTVITVGSTGTGKTETPKVLARELFGSPTKAQIIPMGDISRQEDLTKIFGSSPQFVKSDQMGLFEKAILQIKDGGILVLDEISNAGGKSLAEREQILFKFYNLIEEGYWTSSNTGRRYDLSKIVIWMTGNDLQDHYFGVSGDDMRESIYNKLKDESKVRAELRQRGFPEAILGRAQLVVHTKPLLNKSTMAIARKTLESGFKNLKRQFPGLEISIPDHVLKTTTEVFFNHDQGGRSLRNKFESEIQGLITSAILESGTNEDNASTRSVEINLVDGRSKKHYYLKHVKEEFYVEVILKDKSNGAVLAKLTNNLLDKQEISIKPDAEELVKVSFHEIGHAILNNPEISGQKLRYVTIKPGSAGDHMKYLGYAAYDKVRKQSSGVAELKDQLIRIVGGRVSQEVAGFTSDTGWGSDFQKMKKMIAHFYVESGLDSELWGTNLDKDGNLIGSEKKIEYFDGLVIKEITEAQESARQYLTDHQGLVRFLTAQLVKKQSLTGEDFETLIKYYKGNKLSSIEQELLKDRFNKSNWSANTQVPSDKVSLEKINPEQMQCKVIFK
jgi:ATP-dependent Clp protease ATP-binding subunit ClpC